ncbi:hypothetical protein JXB28_04500 [Candidatus Woesearchaeota archaeon]|nr:hypothetical protein [Candidatus Woesearchaeota archaeon]
MVGIGVDMKEFLKSHDKNVRPGAQKDVFFIWMIIVFISVIAAHFVMNIAGGTPTGFITASESSGSNLVILLGALFVAFISCLVTGLVYIGIGKNDHH